MIMAVFMVMVMIMIMIMMMMAMGLRCRRDCSIRGGVSEAMADNAGFCGHDLFHCYLR